MKLSHDYRNAVVGMCRHIHITYKQIGCKRHLNDVEINQLVEETRRMKKICIQQTPCETRTGLQKMGEWALRACIGC